LTVTEVDAPTLHVLGGPHVEAGGRCVPVPEGSKRLVAFVALNDRRVERCRAASVLWPNADRHRAAGNLRSAIWRLRGAGLDILAADNSWIRLRPELRTDLEGLAQWASRVMSGNAEPADIALRPALAPALDMLPGWYDDWVLLERERLRQPLLQAVETLAHLLVRERRCGEAIDAALVAVSVEPLRESAQRALIVAHLAEGNRCEALRSYGTYEEILERELGICPSIELRRLVTDARTDAEFV